MPIRSAARRRGLRLTVRARVSIHGRVQGVGFRFEARARARWLGLAGWIRNESDGSVAAAFEGDQEQVDAMLEWCRQGPRDARVESVDVEWEPARGGTDFAVG